MYLVVGASGEMGREICRLFISRKKEVRAMVRNVFEPGKTNYLKRMGVQLMQGDLRNPKTFPAALKGVDVVVCTASSMPNSYRSGENDIQKVDLDGMIDLVDAAREAGIKHFIYVSISGNISMDFPLRNAKRTVEQHLRYSGMRFTILRPSFFVESWLKLSQQRELGSSKAKVYGTGANPVSYVSLYDVAQYAVRSVTNPVAYNAIMELGGPQPMSQYDAIREFQNLGLCSYQVEQIPVEALLHQFERAADPMRKSLLGLRIGMAKGDSIPTRTMYQAFHIHMKSVHDIAREHAVA